MFPTKLLLATDGSEEATSAARVAATLSEKLGCELHVAYVEPLHNPYPIPEATLYNRDVLLPVREIAARNARERLDRILEEMGATGTVAAGTHALVGRPEGEIVRLAQEIGAGLVVIGARGLGPLRRALMGSVSGSVLRHAHCPVLVVRGERGGEGPEGGYLPGRILLALEGSREAEAAAEAGVEISEATGSELHLVFVLPTVQRPPYGHPYLSERWQNILEQAQHDSRKIIDDAAVRIEAEGGRVKDAHLRFGEPDREIVRLGEELEAGLIVLGNRGLGGVGRALLGSVSESVARHAHGPVLVVRDGVRDEDGQGGTRIVEEEGEARA